MTSDEKLQEEKRFIERIERLGTGQMASLRRGCGKRDPVEGRCPWLIGLIYGVAPEPLAFLVASLLAQYKTSDIRIGHHSSQKNFGNTWERAISGTDSDSIKRRFSVLLDAAYTPQTGDGDLPYRLRQMVRYSAGKGVGVNWPLLLFHLRSWNSPTKWVQKEWARAFYSSDESNAFTNINEEERS